MGKVFTRIISFREQDRPCLGPQCLNQECKILQMFLILLISAVSRELLIYYAAARQRSSLPFYEINTSLERWQSSWIRRICREKATNTGNVKIFFLSFFPVFFSCWQALQRRKRMLGALFFLTVAKLYLPGCECLVCLESITSCC